MSDVKDAEKYAEEATKLPQSYLNEFLFIFNIISAQLITQIGVSQALSSILIFGEYFNVSSSDQAQLSWSIASYSLTSRTFIVIGGKLGDLIGHKRIRVFGYFWLALWSLIVGFSYYSKRQFILPCLQGHSEYCCN